MKKMKECFAVLLIVLSLGSVTAAASLDNVDLTEAAISVALTDFRNDVSSEVFASFKGVKAWQVKGGVKVKLYLDEPNSLSYACHQHTPNAPFECHEGH